MSYQMCDRVGDPTLPLEAEVAITGSHRDSRVHGRPYPRTVHVELLLANSVGDPAIDLDDRRAQDVSIEGVRAIEIADRDDHVIEAHNRTIRASGGTGIGNSRSVGRVVEATKRRRSP